MLSLVYGFEMHSHAVDVDRDRSTAPSAPAVERLALTHPAELDSQSLTPQF